MMEYLGFFTAIGAIGGALLEGGGTLAGIEALSAGTLLTGIAAGASLGHLGGSILNPPKPPKAPVPIVPPPPPAATAAAPAAAPAAAQPQQLAGAGVQAMGSMAAGGNKAAAGGAAGAALATGPQGLMAPPVTTQATLLGGTQ